MFVILLLVAIAISSPSSSNAFRPIPSVGKPTLYQHNHSHDPVRDVSHRYLYTIRGGNDDLESDYDDYEESDEEEKQVEEEIETLSASAKQVLEKAKKKKKSLVKKTVSESLSKSKKAKRSSSSSSTSILKKIPYIVRAFMNPFTVFAMTKGYFASLFNIDYLQEDISQNLRSALQEKAKSNPTGGSGGGKRARKMKPGQAKTLSDLPQLSA